MHRKIQRSHPKSIQKCLVTNEILKILPAFQIGLKPFTTFQIKV